LFNDRKRILLFTILSFAILSFSITWNKEVLRPLYGGTPVIGFLERRQIY